MFAGVNPYTSFRRVHCERRAYMPPRRVESISKSRAVEPSESFAVTTPVA